MDASQDFKSLQEKIQGALVAVTRSANGIAGEDLDFLRTVNPAVDRQLDEKNERLLRLSNSLLKAASDVAGQQKPVLEDVEDITNSWGRIVDVIDTLLERADTSLDEYTGLIKRKDAPLADAGPAAKKQKNSPFLAASMKRANILKPQAQFEHKADNFPSSPWKPLLTTKPHATVPLEQSLTVFTNDENETQYRHPYETEILQLKFPPKVYEAREPTLYLPVDTTSATWVDTYEGVLEMLAELKKAEEIAVDLEHHDFRSYDGLLSLMQISTREKDWIVDTLKPWRHRLEILNEVFADPKIIKVFHGAYMDITWLQRDLGLYVVGLFDTYQAAVALGYPGRGLAYLLKRFADFDADKKYQMADWRIRPLPEEMLYYARSDTHYLLYIYDMVCSELIKRSDRSKPDGDLVEWVLQMSKETSLERFQPYVAQPETGHGNRGWFNVLLKSSFNFNKEQFAVYKAIHAWRDNMARKEDESPMFIMTNQAVVGIARQLPQTKPELLDILKGGNGFALQTRTDELLNIVRKAKAEGANGPSMMDVLRSESVAAVASRHLPGKTATKPVPAAEPVPDAVEEPVPSAKELKSSRTQLWGEVKLSSLWDGDSVSRQAQATRDAKVVVPWAGFMTATSGTAPSAAERTDSHIESEDVQMVPLEAETRATVADSALTSGDEGEFTLKRKRKLAESDSGDSQSENDDSAEDEAEEASESGGKMTKKERKAAAKAQKRAERAARKEARAARKAAKKAAKVGKIPNALGIDLDGNDIVDDEEPFDYTKAQSVLHAQRTQSKPTAKVFDPYAKKTSDAPQGARKMNYEKAGKSATFRK